MKKRTLYTLLFSLLSLCVMAQPDADFTATPWSGCLGTTFQFTDSSTGNVVSWLWNFNDGNTSMEQNPSHVYTNSGIYQVCLTVTDDLGETDSLCQSGLITVLDISTSLYEETLCSGDDIIINGTTYNETNPTAQEIIVGGDVNGCDSIININLTFYPIATSSVTASYCPEDLCYDFVDGMCYTTGTYNIPLLGASFNGCDSIVILDVVETAGNLSITNSEIENVSCNGAADGSICVSGVSCGQPPFSYLWNTGPSSTSACVTGLSAGTYTVTVTDDNNSTLTETYILLEPTQLEITTLNVIDVSCNGEDDGSIDLTVSNSSPPYTYSWSNGELSSVISNLSPGTYTVTITNIDGCQLISPNIIVGEPSEIAISVTTTAPTCGNSDGSIDLNLTGGVQPYEYLWSNNEITQALSNLAAGTYSVTVSDANGCTAMTTTNLSSGLTLESEVTDVNCNGANNGNIDLTVTTGQSPYEYIWSNGAITEDITGLASGEYTVTVTDASLCSAVSIIVVEENSGLTFLVDVTTANCAGDLACTTVFDITGGIAPFTYEWTDSSTDSSYCAPSGLFSVTVTDANGCTGTNPDINLAAPTPLQIASNSTCVSPGQSDGIITITVSGGTAPYLYEWENGVTTDVIGDLGNGNYSITVTDVNGCTISTTVTLGIIEAMSPDTLACAGSATVFVIAPTATSYNWEPAAFLTDPTAASSSTTMVTDSTLFTVTVTDANGCEDVGSTWIEIPDGPGFILQTISPSCGQNDGSIDLSIMCETSAPYTYDWDDLPGNNDTEDRTDLSAGTYSVTVTDNNGVTSVEVVTLSDNDNVMVSIQVPTVITCAGEELIICATASSTMADYLWTGPNGFTSTDTCIFIVPPAGSTVCYELVVTDINGCTGEGDFCIDTPDEILLTTSPDAIICAGESTGIQVTTSGNSADYTYAWSPVDNIDDPNLINPTVSPLVTTTYTVVVVENNTGCQAAASVTINVIEDCVWPGDTDTNKVVNNFDLLNIGLAFDSIGPIRPGANMMWFGQEAPDWTQAVLSGVNYKHIDCDGNGLVDANDTLAITGNWGETHNFSGDPIQQYVHDYPQADGFMLDAPFYVQADTLIEGMQMSLPIILGEEANAAEDVYGIAYSLTYDTAYIVPGSVEIGFGNSWLGLNNNNMITVQRDFPSEGRVDIAMTRIDGMSISDFGQLAQLFITVEDDILFAPGGGGEAEFFVDDAAFNIINVLVINSSGEEIPVIPMETTAPVETLTSNDNIILAEAVRVHPNPAKDRIWVTSKNIQIEHMLLFDLNGKLIQSTAEPSLSVQQVPTGLYLLKVQTEAGVHVEKVMVE